MKIADTKQDLVAEGAEVAIRLGKLEDSGFGARKLTDLERYLVASPDYLKRCDTPKTPAELSEHGCIFGPGGLEAETWSFTRNRTVTSVNVRGRIQTDSGSGLFASVMAGLGMPIASTAMAEAELRSGALTRSLPGCKLPLVEVHAIFPGGPRPSAKTRAFVDFLTEEIQNTKPSCTSAPFETSKELGGG